ncbi:hypothetical protein Tco_1385579 [Tanacetum coccineum]
MQGIANVAIGGIRFGVCRQSGEERGTMLGVNLAGSEDRVLKKMYSVLGSNLKFGKWQERTQEHHHTWECGDKPITHIPPEAARNIYVITNKMFAHTLFGIFRRMEIDSDN